jgi:hypothetical protein
VDGHRLLSPSHAGGVIPIADDDGAGWLQSLLEPRSLECTGSRGVVRGERRTGELEHTKILAARDSLVRSFLYP